MAIIIVSTPPDEKNSEYSAHIIEHTKLSLFYPDKNAFLWKNIHGYTYTTHTEYHLPTNQKNFRKNLSIISSHRLIKIFLKKKKFAFRTNYQTNDFIKRLSNFLEKNILTPNIRMEM